MNKDIRRGQVWNIDDEMHSMMKMLRDYNREHPDYWGFTKGVVIVKSDKMINTPSLDPLIVVPLVAIRRYARDTGIPRRYVSDIKIPRILLASQDESNVYPLVGSLFTVDDMHLVDYVCTLPDVYMSEIDKKLQELLFE